MRTRWQNIALAVGIVLVAVGVVLAGIYPYRPDTLLGWIVLVGLALPLILVLEYGGEKILNPEFAAHLGRYGRFAYGVVILAVLLGLVLVGFQFLQSYLKQWGS